MDVIQQGIIHYASTSAQPKCGLMCFPFAGGGTVNYGKWRPDLNPEIDLYALNLPGRERFFGKPFLTDFAALVVALASIFKTKTEMPWIFFGHSFGGLTAYFTALELKKMGCKIPAHLILSARAHPLDDNTSKIADLDHDAFTAMVIERYAGVPQAILESPSLLKMFVPIIQHDFKMYEQFHDLFNSYGDNKVNCDITTIGYDSDKVAEERFHLWKDYTTGSYQHLQLPGGHFEILNQWKTAVEYVNSISGKISR